jgi:hypothetical protein
MRSGKASFTTLYANTASYWRGSGNFFAGDIRNWCLGCLLIPGVGRNPRAPQLAKNSLSTCESERFAAASRVWPSLRAILE